MQVGELLSSAIDQCQSQLSGTGLECLIISAVDLGLASSVDSLNALCRCSLLAAQASSLDIDLNNEVSAALDKLVQASAIIRSGADLALSKIGKAAVKGTLNIYNNQVNFCKCFSLFTGPILTNKVPNEKPDFVDVQSDFIFYTFVSKDTGCPQSFSPIRKT